MKKNLLPIILLIILLTGGIAWIVAQKETPQEEPVFTPTITTFNECVAAGNPVMESYPRRCTAQGKTFTENIGNALEKQDLIQLTSPLPNSTVQSPLTITGKARGTWFFEASFPITLTDSAGNVLGQGIAQAQGDWMTTDFVPFAAILSFTTSEQAVGDTATLTLRKDNPSGLPENDDALIVPVTLGTPTEYVGTVLVSSEDAVAYCNGADMDSAGYRATITVPQTFTIPEPNPTTLQIIKATINASTTGMCNTALAVTPITEANGIVTISRIDAWAGVGITMCSCKPLVEVNLLRIPGITKIIWE